MDMNKFVEKDLPPDRANAIFEGLLAESERRFGFDRLVEENTDVPELSRYRYCFFSGTLTSEGKQEEKTLEIDHGELNPDGAKALADGKTGGHLNVKLEFPAHVKLMEVVKFLRTGKKAIESQLNQLLEITCNVEIKCKTDPAFVPKFKECEAKSKDLTSFINLTRTSLVEAECIDKQDEDNLHKAFDKVDKMFQACKAHSDGMKHFLRDVRALIK